MQHMDEGDESIGAERKRRKAKWKFKYRPNENKFIEIFPRALPLLLGTEALSERNEQFFLQTFNL